MAIRKDLDDMLNSLMDGGGSSADTSTPARSHTTPRAARKSKFDNMSVDDLLHALYKSCCRNLSRLIVRIRAYSFHKPIRKI